MLYLINLVGFLVLGYILIRAIPGLTKEKSQIVLDKAKDIGKNQYSLLSDVSIGFWYSNGNMHYPETSRIGDIFIFQDFIFWARERRLFLTRFAPTVISFRNLKSVLDPSTENYFPAKFIYWEEKRMEVQIHLASSQYKHITAVLTLKGLNTEQIFEVKAFQSRVKPITPESTNH